MSLWNMCYDAEVLWAHLQLSGHNRIFQNKHNKISFHGLVTL